MAVTINLPAGALANLEAEATRRGLRVDELIAEFAAGLVPGATSSGRPSRPAFVAVGASGTGVSDRIDEILADGFGRD